MRRSTNPIVNMLQRNAVNLDITHRCPLECPRCQRATSFTSKGLKVPGHDMSVIEFTKIVEHFKHINFCGQVSDPVHHPKFAEFLEILYEAGTSVSVHHATGAKPRRWYPKAFQANPNARWWFGIDGLPGESHKYRINQDGQKLFDIMVESIPYLKQLPVWQYIVFKYNQDHIEEAHNMAKEAGVQFMVVNSSRWLNGEDEYRPTKEHSLSLHDG